MRWKNGTIISGEKDKFRGDNFRLDGSCEIKITYFGAALERGFFDLYYQKVKQFRLRE